jgi:hypothetical protein
MVIATIGLLATQFFASEQYSKQLWLLLAMGPALLALARTPPSRPVRASSRGTRRP